MYSGNRRFQCLSNYFSNYKSLLFCCPRSKKGPLVIWGGGRLEYLVEGVMKINVKAIMDSFQLWLHDKMLWLQHFIICHILIFCIIVLPFLFFWVLISFRGKNTRVYIKFSTVVRYLILKFRNCWFDMKSVLFQIETASYL